MLTRRQQLDPHDVDLDLGALERDEVVADEQDERNGEVEVEDRLLDESHAAVEDQKHEQDACARRRC